MSDDEVDNFRVELPDIVEFLIERHCNCLEVRKVDDIGTLQGTRCWIMFIRNITSPWTKWKIYAVGTEISIGRDDGKKVPVLLNDTVNMIKPEGTDDLIKLLKKLNVLLL